MVPCLAPGWMRSVAPIISLRYCMMRIPIPVDFEIDAGHPMPSSATEFKRHYLDDGEDMAADLRGPALNLAMV